MLDLSLRDEKEPCPLVAKYEGRERRLDVAEYLSIARALNADPYRLLRAADKVDE